MNFKKNTKFSEVLKEYPGMAEYLYRKDKRLRFLKNSLVVQIMAPRISLAKMAKRNGLQYEELVSMMNEAVESDDLTNPKDVIERNRNVLELKDKLKGVMKKLFNDEDIENTKREFKDIISKANPIIIAIAEGELTNEGYTIQDLMKSCDLHLEFFKEQLVNSRKSVPSSHPLWRFIKDHDAIMYWIEQGLKISRKLSNGKDFEDAKDLIDELKTISLKLKNSENHDVRQENTLFPVLERYGIEQPPAIMWDEHSKMKDRKNELQKALEHYDGSYEEFAKYVQGIFMYLSETFAAHTQKEQEILYNVALETLSDKDWENVKNESDQLGYFKLPKEVLNDE